jgi:protocatechuate 3,4-dioxygenase beta subunit
MKNFRVGFRSARASASTARVAIRRGFGIAVVLGLGFLAGPGVQGAPARPTPPDDYGPFYPLDWAGEIDADLAAFGGRAAEGSLLAISGTVVDARQRAVKDAVVEIWQTDARGRYRHPGIPGETRDPGFQGYGRVQTDAAGRYAFKTVFPGRYGGRPPHVHIRVAPPGRPEFVSQIYFRGDNREGGAGGGLPPGREALTVDPGKTPAGSWAVRFDIVLPER